MEIGPLAACTYPFLHFCKISLQYSTFMYDFGWLIFSANIWTKDLRVFTAFQMWHDHCVRARISCLPV